MSQPFCFTCIYPSQLKGLPPLTGVWTELETHSVSGWQDWNWTPISFRFDVNITWMTALLLKPRLQNTPACAPRGTPSVEKDERRREKTWLRYTCSAHYSTKIVRIAMAWMCCCNAEKRVSWASPAKAQFSPFGIKTNWRTFPSMPRCSWR